MTLHDKITKASKTASPVRASGPRHQRGGQFLSLRLRMPRSSAYRRMLQAHLLRAPAVFLRTTAFRRRPDARRNLLPRKEQALSPDAGWLRRRVRSADEVRLSLQRPHHHRRWIRHRLLRQRPGGLRAAQLRRDRRTAKEEVADARCRKRPCRDDRLPRRGSRRLHHQAMFLHRNLLCGRAVELRHSVHHGVLSSARSVPADAHPRVCAV